MPLLVLPARSHFSWTVDEGKPCFRWFAMSGSQEGYKPLWEIKGKSVKTYLDDYGIDYIKKPGLVGCVMCHEVQHGKPRETYDTRAA